MKDRLRSQRQKQTHSQDKTPDDESLKSVSTSHPGRLDSSGSAGLAVSTAGSSSSGTLVKGRRFERMHSGDQSTKSGPGSVRSALTESSHIGCTGGKRNHIPKSKSLELNLDGGKSPTPRYVQAGEVRRSNTLSFGAESSAVKTSGFNVEKKNPSLLSRSHSFLARLGAKTGKKERNPSSASGKSDEQSASASGMDHPKVDGKEVQNCDKTCSCVASEKTRYSAVQTAGLKPVAPSQKAVSTMSSASIESVPNMVKKMPTLQSCTRNTNSSKLTGIKIRSLPSPEDPRSQTLSVSNCQYSMSNLQSKVPVNVPDISTVRETSKLDHTYSNSTDKFSTNPPDGFHSNSHFAPSFNRSRTTHADGTLNRLSPSVLQNISEPSSNHPELNSFRIQPVATPLLGAYNLQRAKLERGYDIVTAIDSRLQQPGSSSASVGWMDPNRAYIRPSPHHMETGYVVQLRPRPHIQLQQRPQTVRPSWAQRQISASLSSLPVYSSMSNTCQLIGIPEESPSVESDQFWSMPSTDSGTGSDPFAMTVPPGYTTWQEHGSMKTSTAREGN